MTTRKTPGSDHVIHHHSTRNEGVETTGRRERLSVALTGLSEKWKMQAGMIPSVAPNLTRGYDRFPTDGRSV